jgi:hypothetical protein
MGKHIGCFSLDSKLAILSLEVAIDSKKAIQTTKQTIVGMNAEYDKY